MREAEAPDILERTYSVLSYTVALQKHSSEFDIPFDRRLLANNLNLERTNTFLEPNSIKRPEIRLQAFLRSFYTVSFPLLRFGRF